MRQAAEAKNIVRIAWLLPAVLLRAASRSEVVRSLESETSSFLSLVKGREAYNAISGAPHTKRDAMGCVARDLCVGGAGVTFSKSLLDMRSSL